VSASTTVSVDTVSDFDGIVAGNTYRLQGRSGLIALAEFVNRGSGLATSGVNFVLIGENESDIIDFANSGIAPIGYYSTNADEQFESPSNFYGNFDGRNVLVKNLNIVNYVTNELDYKGTGFFGSVYGTSVIENIIIENASVSSSIERIGVLIGNSEGGRFENITIRGDISISGTRIEENHEIGVLAGTIEDSEIINIQLNLNQLSLNGGNNLGGFIGEINDGSINNSMLSITSGFISGESNLAGFVGRYNGGSISETSINTSGLRIAGTRRLGGFIGRMERGATLSNNTLTATDLSVSGTTGLGGFIGVNEEGILTNNKLVVDQLFVRGSSPFVGGFIGQNGESDETTAGDVAQSFLSARIVHISGVAHVGGFVGGNTASSIISNSFVSVSNSMTIDAATNVGGFAGLNTSNSTIINSYIMTDNIGLIGSNKNVGGFVGSNGGEFDDESNAIISNSFVSADSLTITASNENGGGFAGQLGYESIIENAFMANRTFSVNSADISSVGDFVGLIIENVSGLIINSYYNSGLLNDSWFEFDADGGISTGISIITDAKLIDILHSGLNEENQVFQRNLVDENYNFPFLKAGGAITLLNQPKTEIYWLIGQTNPDGSSPETNNNQPISLPSSRSRIFNNPSVGETYTYDPVFLTLELDETPVEVGEEIDLTYRGFSTFGPIIRDYTEDVVVTGTVNTSVLGVYPITLTLTAEGLTLTKTFTIRVVDTITPVITGPTSVQLFVDELYESELTVSDNVDTDVTLVALKELDTSVAGITDIVWQATDASGNVSTFSQTVEVLRPKVESLEVIINNQSFVFVVSEAEFDIDNLQVEYIVSTTTPAATSTWSVFTTSPSVDPGETVYVRLSDGINVSPIRQTIPIPEPVITRGEVVYPEIEESSSSALVIGGSILGVLLLSVGSWWFVFGKRRKKENE
jgi:hypothetical protein